MKLSHFKKIHDDEKIAILKNHKGHEIKISKRGLDKHLTKELKALPLHYDEGGEVPETKTETKEESKPFSKRVGSTIREGIKDAAGTFERVGNRIADPIKGFASGLMESDEPAEEAQGMSEDANESDTIPQGSPQQPMQSMPENEPLPTGQVDADQFKNAMDQAKSGIMGQAEAQGELGRKQADEAEAHAKRTEEAIKQHEQNLVNAHNEYLNFKADMQNMHFDPDRYIKNMPAGQKVATAFGLILGGIGSGITGQPNAAMSFIDKQIAHDIETQKLEYGKRHSIYSAAMDLFKNQEEATKLTQALSYGVMSARFEQLAGQAKNDIERNRAKQAAAEFDLKAMPILADLQMKQHAMRAMSQGNLEPERAIRVLVPEKLQKDAYKEYQEAQNLSTAIKDFESSANQMEKLVTLASRIKDPIQSRSKIEAIKGAIIPKLSKESAGRYTESDSKALMKSLPALGDDAKTAAFKRRERRKILGDKYHFPMLKAYGVPLPKIDTPVLNPNAPGK